MAHMDRFTRFVLLPLLIYLFSKLKRGVSECVTREECVALGGGVQKSGGTAPD